MTDADAAAAALRAAHEAMKRGDSVGAEAKCREAIALGRDDAQTWALLGSTLRKRDPAAAEIALRRAIEGDARSVDAQFQLGNLQREQGRYAQAVSSYERALALVPGHASLLNNLGLALEGADQRRRAEQCYREVLLEQPRHRQALGNLAHLLCRNGEHAEALRHCETYLAAYADADPTVWLDHGICAQRHLHDGERAERSYRRALALAPHDGPTIVNLATLLIERNDHAEAAALLARVGSADAHSLYAMTLLSLARQHLCAWDGLEALHAGVGAAIDACAAGECLANPFAVLTIPLPASAHRRVARAWARFWWPARIAPPARTTPAPAARRRLRLAYLSSDLRTHPLSFLLAEVWERHDRTRFETIAYSIGPREQTPLRQRVESAFDGFVDCFDESAAATAERIRDDGVDVLIDLNGYTQRARPEILARRPAPLQIGWLGYLGTMGADWIDYVLTDRFATPEDQQSVYTERLLYLPECYCPSDTRREIAAPTHRAAAGLPDDAFVFCCFNSTYKILPAMFDVWMRLLAQVPHSVLWLSPGNGAAMENLRREARARDVDPQRLVFAPHVVPAEHFARQPLADLFLDTLPYNAGTTANDALLMGLPVLTCAGTAMAGRVAASQLRAAGLPELATFDTAQYEARALALARDADLLGSYRRRLRESRPSSPLFDMARFTRALEATLRQVAR